jgi:aminotransferase
MVKGVRELGLSLTEPHGAFYVFPSIRSTGMEDFDFAQRLLDEEKVAVIPGSAFGEGGRGHVRMCYASPYNLLEEALERIGRFVARHS